MFPRDRQRSAVGARALVPVAAVAALGISSRVWLQSALDLSDLPGAAGVLAVTQASLGEFSRSWGVWFIGLLGPLCDWNVADAAHLTALVSGCLMIIGTMLGGWAIASWVGAVGAGITATCWSIAALPVLLVGADPPAVGLAWFGLGLAWAGARAPVGIGIPMVVVGTATTVLAAAVKEIAMPALLMLLATPLLMRVSVWRVALLLPAQGLAAWWSWEFFAPRRVHEAAGLPAFEVQALIGGYERLMALPQHGWPEGIFHQMMALALLAGVLPGRAFARRLLLSIGAVALLVATAAALDRRVRPRLLLTTAYGMVVMVGVGAAVVSTWVKRWRLQAIPILALGALLMLDSWAWVHDFAVRRVRFAEASMPTIPAAPAAWARRYGDENYSALRDLTLAGAVPLHGWVTNQPADVVATLRLRDDRHRHVEAAARLRGGSAVTLDRGKCCSGLDEDRCATELVSALERAGVGLALPLQTPAVRRVNRQDDAWLKALRTAAGRTGKLESVGTWWEVLPAGTGSGKVPCGATEPSPNLSELPWPPELPKKTGGQEGRRQRPRHQLRRQGG